MACDGKWQQGAANCGVAKQLWKGEEGSLGVSGRQLRRVDEGKTWMCGGVLARPREPVAQWGYGLPEAESSGTH